LATVTDAAGFCELALAYPPARVSDPAQRIAAANGQFLLVEREALRRLGGHASVAEKVLEDVELAFLAKRRNVGLRFRYAEDAVSTRMYRSTTAMIEGWTKNLALLFDNCLALAFWRVLDIALLSCCGAGGMAVERAFCRPFTAMAGRRLGAGHLVGAQPLPLLRTRCQIQLSLCRLRRGSTRAAAVYCAALPQLVPAQDSKRVSWKGRSYKT